MPSEEVNPTPFCSTSIDLDQAADSNTCGRACRDRVMRLQTECTPDALHTQYRNACRTRHVARTPVRRASGSTFERFDDNGFDTLIRDRARGAGPRLVVQGTDSWINV
jgi:hypothetical protein